SGNVIAVWIAAAFSLAVAGWMIYSGRAVPWGTWTSVAVLLWLKKEMQLREILDVFKSSAGADPGKPGKRFLFVIGLGWLALTLLTAPAYAQQAVSVTLLLFVSAIAYVVVLWWRLGRLEQEYLLPLPFRLLALRVFGSPFLADFMVLTAKWRWLGTTQRLDGPDTAGDRSGDVFAMLRGRLDTRIVEDETELEDALTHFAEKPDGDLRYAVNSIQCTDATWRAALDRLLTSADIIVMDLSGFSQERLGCKYELGKLIGAQALDRVLLLIDESTDRALLESVLKEAWRAAYEADPKRTMPHRVTVIETGGVTERGPQESEYAWKKRLAARLEGDLLVALMVDKALAGRTAGARADVAAAVRWTRASSHRRLNLLAKASLVLIALISLFMTIGNYRAHPSGPDAARTSSSELWIEPKRAGFARPASSGRLGAVTTSHRRHAC
ncbi:MAG: hypothetical protein ACJ8E1_23105, partial [Xanthobacteraceae bacterium]